MKKRKARRRKDSAKRANLTLTAAAISRQERASKGAIQEKEDLRSALLKRDIYKRVENGAFVPKRYFSVARQFLVDAKVELKKVTWPTRKELLSTTAVVLILVFLIAFFLGIVDLGLVKIIRNVVG
jgi:preprotein translocase subunit SecE